MHQDYFKEFTVKNQKLKVEVLELPYFVKFADDATNEDKQNYYKLYYKQREELARNSNLKRYEFMSEPTEEQIKEVVEYLKRWDKKTVFKFGYWFKLIDDTNLEVFNDKQNEFMVISL